MIPQKPQKTAPVTNMLIHRCGQSHFFYYFSDCYDCRSEAYCPLFVCPIFAVIFCISGWIDAKHASCIIAFAMNASLFPARQTIPEHGLSGKVFLSIRSGCHSAPAVILRKILAVLGKGSAPTGYRQQNLCFTRMRPTYWLKNCLTSKLWLRYIIKQLVSMCSAYVLYIIYIS